MKATRHNGRSGKHGTYDAKEKLYQQLAIDYCCPVSDIKDSENHFTEYKRIEGRGHFPDRLLR